MLLPRAGAVRHKVILLALATNAGVVTLLGLAWFALRVDGRPSSMLAFGGLAAVASLGALAVFRWSRSLTAPLTRLARKARALSETRESSASLGASLGHEAAEFDTPDEVGTVDRALDAVVSRLRQSDAALAEATQGAQTARELIETQAKQLDETTRELEIQIAERERAEERARVLAFHDALTGLPNRLLFNDRLRLALAQARRHKRSMAVMFVDLDRFKFVNDSLGHTLGDELLRQVAERLIATVRHTDTVARLGGDEFTLLLPDLHGPEDAAQNARKILNATRRPFLLDGRELYVTPSIGVAVYPEDGRDVDTLLKNADTAMYRAKDEGRDNFQCYTATMNHHALKRLSLESGLRRALPNHELSLEYQPVVNLDGGEIHGFEALLRWKHPLLGSVAPSEFVPVAEATGLILPIGPWVLRTACAQVRRWQETRDYPLAIAVNLSARQFEQADLAEQILRALEETGLSPENLEIEIVESSAMRNTDGAVRTLRALKDIGVRISIDDFGVGYSSLSYLRRLPIDTLKIDRSFVRDITIDPDDAAIVGAVVDLAQTLKLRVVAEGVETEEQLSFLKDRGCDRMQGYLASVPLPPDACFSFLETYPDRLARSYT
jgi:diguanylate cyclase (GGDEF)-like protein